LSVLSAGNISFGSKSENQKRNLLVIAAYHCGLSKAIEVIKSCTTRIELDELGEILRTERDWYDEHKIPEAVQPWRDAWAKQAKYLREEEERLQPMKARKLAADAWYSSWQGVLRCCRDFTGIRQLEPEIKHQSQDFGDLPEVVQEMQQLVKQRWQEIQKFAV
jgi:hypothetical protein